MHQRLNLSAQTTATTVKADTENKNKGKTINRGNNKPNHYVLRGSTRLTSNLE